MADKSAGTKGKSIVQGIIAIGVTLAVILGGAYYQEDIGTFAHLHGWQPGPPQDVVRTFIHQAAAGDPGAMATLDAKVFTPVLRSKKLIAIQSPGPQHPIIVPVERIIPSGDVKSTEAKILYQAHKFGVTVQYSNGRWGVFRVGLTAEGWKITDIPDSLSQTRPGPDPFN